MFLSLKIKQLKYIFLVVQFNFSTILVKKFSRVVGGLGCVGKKTTLLQAEASACVSGLANVLFCALAVIFSFFFFLSLSSKLSAVSFFLHLAVVESRKGISPLRSHRTVRETLASYGSSCSITNVIKHYG